MTRSPAARVLAFAVVVALLVTAISGGVAGDGHQEYVVEQGDQCIPVAPVQGSQPVEEFYDYRAYDSDYSSQATQQYQSDDTSTLMLYEGPNGLNLVIVHDQWHDDNSDGTDGGSASFSVTNLPTSGEWVVEDDDYGSQTDEFNHGGSESQLHWTWSLSRTDGAAFNGLGNDFQVQIDARWNDDAELTDSLSGTYNGNVTDWQVIVPAADGGSFDRVSLQNLDQPVTIRSGTCGTDGPTAALDAPSQAAVGESISLDASGSTASAGIAEYRWSIDGEQVAVTDEPTFQTAFDEAGTYQLGVTVVDGNGETDTATSTITIESSGPTAALNAPAEAAVNETVTLDASGSTADGGVAEYRWAIDGEQVAVTNEPTFQTAFDETGTYQLGVTVVDGNGNTDTATSSITIESSGPTASLSVPGSATVNETVTFDASGSTTSGNATYEWSIDGEVVGETSAAQFERAFAETGEHTVSVTVRDESGQTDTASGAVQVSQPLSAAIDASSTEVTAGDTVEFDGSGSTGSIASYEWSFGDGAGATGATAPHTFESPGQYEVELVVRDGDGGTATDTIVVDVSADGGDGGDGNDGDGSDGDSGDGNDDGGDAGGDDPGDGDSGGDDTGDDGSNGSGGSSGSDGSTGGQSSSGSGGYSPPQTHVATIDADADDEAVRFTADGVDADDTVEAPVEFGGVVVLETVTFVATDDADTVDGSVSHNDGSPPGDLPADVGFLLDTDAPVSATEWTVSVDRSTVEDRGIDPEDLTLYRYDGEEWVPVDTSIVDETEERIQLSGETDGATRVGLGIDGDAVSVSGVAADPVAGTPFEVNVTLRNAGSEAGDVSVPVTVDGEEVGTVSETVPAESEVTATITTTVSDPGDVSIEAGTVSESVTVREATTELSVVELRTTTDGIGVGDEVTIVVVVENTGTAAGEFVGDVTVAGSTVGTVTGEVEPGERRELEFTQRIDSAGDFDVGVGDATTTVEVTGTETEARTETPTETDDEIPGFTVSATLLGLLVALLIAGRRSGSRSQ